MKRLAIAVASLLVIYALGTVPAAAEQQSCRENGSLCSDGKQCCSRICTRPDIGSSTCTAN